MINLFATLNRLHDWTYDLGFTEGRYNFQAENFGKGGSGGDAVLGDAQAAALDAGGGAAYLAVPAATPPDGTPPTVEMHLWQPVAATFYGPCVDGDFDASVIAHAFGRATADRMAAGPADGVAKTSGPDGQAQALREGWADVIAAEFLRETAGSGSSVIGAYVSGSPARGLRNYAMTASPLNFSNVRGWDGSGAGMAADDGEVWAAALFEVRKAYVARYGASGGRRFVRVVFDSLPDVAADASMLRARDAFIARAAAADRTLVWRAFARRGFGERAAGTVNSAQPRRASRPRERRAKPRSRSGFVPWTRAAAMCGARCSSASTRRT